MSVPVAGTALGGIGTLGNPRHQFLGALETATRGVAVVAV
jgi:hypothetical protein